MPIPSFSPFFVTVPLGLLIFGLTLIEYRRKPPPVAVGEDDIFTRLRAGETIELGALPTTFTSDPVDGFTFKLAEHSGGLLLSLEQFIDHDLAQPSGITLTDLRKLHSEGSHTVRELHNPDGTFKYGKVNLDLATAGSELYFGRPERWWFIQKGSKPKISYTWGSQRTRGDIEIEPGDWIASLEISINESKFTKRVKFSWNGSGDVKCDGRQ